MKRINEIKFSIKHLRSKSVVFLGLFDPLVDLLDFHLSLDVICYVSVEFLNQPLGCWASVFSCGFFRVF